MRSPSARSQRTRCAALAVTALAAVCLPFGSLSSCQTFIAGPLKASEATTSLLGQHLSELSFREGQSTRRRETVAYVSLGFLAGLGAVCGASRPASAENFLSAPSDAPRPEDLPKPKEFVIDMSKLSSRLRKNLKPKKSIRDVEFYMGCIPEPGWTEPPEPTWDPAERAKQKSLWINLPYKKTGQWLMMAKGPAGFAIFGHTYCIHQSIDLNDPGYYEWDLVQPGDFAEAAKSGRILRDPNIYDPDNDVETFVYASEKDREWCENNFKDKRHISAPSQLKVFVNEVKDVPYPEYDPVKNPKPVMRYNFGVIWERQWPKPF